MAMEKELAALCTQTVKAYAPSGTDPYGQTAYSPTPLVMKCHIVGRYEEVTDKRGETVVANGHAILTTCYPGLNDKYILDIPDLSAASGRRRVNIISVITRYDEKGPHHQVIYYGQPGAYAGGITNG